MAEQIKSVERQYIIPLRRFWLNVPEYERTGRAIKAIKQFIARHMKIPERDTNKVKLDVYLNNDLWFKGRRHPPSKIKVRVIKEGENVKVTFVDKPAIVNFLKQKHAKFFVKKEKKPEKVEEIKPVAEQKTEEEKTEEKEKEIASAEQNLKQAELDAKAQKHVTKVKEPKIQRMALKK